MNSFGSSTDFSDASESASTVGSAVNIATGKCLCEKIHFCSSSESLLDESCEIIAKTFTYFTLFRLLLWLVLFRSLFHQISNSSAPSPCFPSSSSSPYRLPTNSTKTFSSQVLHPNLHSKCPRRTLLRILASFSVCRRRKGSLFIFNRFCKPNQRTTYILTKASLSGISRGKFITGFLAKRAQCLAGKTCYSTESLCWHPEDFFSKNVQTLRFALSLKSAICVESAIAFSVFFY